MPTRALLIFAAAVVGLILVGTSLFLLHAPKSLSKGRQTVAIHEDWLTRSDFLGWHSDTIEIMYPESIAISDSDTVEAKWTLKGPGLSHFQLRESLFGDKAGKREADFVLKPALTLSGAAFDIKPHETLEAVLEKDQSFTSWSWTISPHKEGSHKLLLDLRDLQIHLLGGDHHASMRRNGKSEEIERPGLDNVVLPIVVLTKERMTLRTFLILKYFLAVAGALMLYPAVSEFVTKMVNKSKHNKRKKKPATNS